ncbi:unnamed protein product, partial [Ectocarpus sp. 12 AP-2014]
MLRCISRKVYNTPDLHEIVRIELLDHITLNIDQPIPEQVQVFGSAPTTYSSVEQYLQFQSQPYAYATNLEMIAANAIYDTQFRTTVHGFPY